MGEIEYNAFILGDFNIPLTPKDRSTRQEISKKTEALKNALEQMDLTDIYRTLHPKADQSKINKTEKNKTIERINETRSWFFKKMNKIDKPLARLIKNKKSTQNQK